MLCIAVHAQNGVERKRLEMRVAMRVCEWNGHISNRTSPSGLALLLLPLLFDFNRSRNEIFLAHIHARIAMYSPNDIIQYIYRVDACVRARARINVRAFEAAAAAGEAHKRAEKAERTNARKFYSYFGQCVSFRTCLFARSTHLASHFGIIAWLLLSLQSIPFRVGVSLLSMRFRLFLFCFFANFA